MSDHHGEFKVPGGKLVIADLTVGADATVSGDGAGVITAASINGDFFLEPDEALLDINRALTGLPENTPAADLAAEMRAPENQPMRRSTIRDVTDADLDNFAQAIMTMQKDG